jgi:Resolvase, N terminal domain
MDSGVEFVATDNPHANKLTVHILAAVAQHERKMIAQRTRDALLAAKTPAPEVFVPAFAAWPTGFAGHAGATANLKLTFHLDHSAGADHSVAGS